VLETGMSEQRIPYQSVLRALGADLDACSATQVTLVELADSFLARYLLPDASTQVETAHWPIVLLLHRSDELRHKRARLRRGHSSDQEQYQDLFRALGYELDQVPAYSLTLDELEDRLLVTYLYHDPQQGYVLLKRLVILGDEDRRQLLRAAQGRRVKSRFF
jgi:hypothetical protein